MSIRGVVNEDPEKDEKHDPQREEIAPAAPKSYVLCAGQIVELTEYQDYQEGL